jgi:hypothetical protein
LQAAGQAHQEDRVPLKKRASRNWPLLENQLNYSTGSMRPWRFYYKEVPCQALPLVIPRSPCLHFEDAPLQKNRQAFEFVAFTSQTQLARNGAWDYEAEWMTFQTS